VCTLFLHSSSQRVAMQFIQPITTMHQAADANSVTVSQGLFGERVQVIDAQGKWVHIRNTRDDYEGFVLQAALGEACEDATHTVCHRGTLLFRQPDIKSRVLHTIPFGAELRLVEQIDESFSVTDTGAYVWHSHCCLAQQTCSDFAVGEHGSLHIGDQDTESHERREDDLAGFAASHFLGAPYLWGGRSPTGFDCSGLVQMATFAVGVQLPRDSHQQEAFLTKNISFSERRRSDLVYWPGHVGILMNETQLLHATAHSLQSLIEPLDAVQSRAGSPSSIKRLNTLARE